LRCAVGAVYAHPRTPMETVASPTSRAGEATPLRVSVNTPQWLGFLAPLPEPHKKERKMEK